MLISFLTKRTYEKQIATFDDLAYSDIEYGGFYLLRYYFKDSDNKIFKRIDTNWKYCSLSQVCVKKNGQPRVKCLKDTIVQMIITCQIYKGLFYLERINDVIWQLHSSGIISKLDKDIQKFKKLILQISNH